MYLTRKVRDGVHTHACPDCQVCFSLFIVHAIMSACESRFLTDLFAWQVLVTSSLKIRMFLLGQVWLELTLRNSTIGRPCLVKLKGSRGWKMKDAEKKRSSLINTLSWGVSEDDKEALCSLLSTQFSAGFRSSPFCAFRLFFGRANFTSRRDPELSWFSVSLASTSL